MIGDRKVTSQSKRRESMQGQIEEKDVEIRTPEYVCDAAFFYPAQGVHPGVFIWTDAYGLRPSMRGMGKRLAAEGYAVLVPNPFYRAGSASALNLSPQTVSFQDPEGRERLQKVMSSVRAPDAAEKDAAAYVAFLDAQAQVDKSRKIGVQGYCMGGALAFRTAASLPDRIGAGASFHGGGLVTDAPDSPHRLVPKMQARMYVGIAANDDEGQPEAKDRLREAFAAAKVPAEVEVYEGLHGWCVPDSKVYNEPEAEKAWAKLLALYKSALK
jgi:carboxymethylenebutenolidase